MLNSVGLFCRKRDIYERIALNFGLEN